MPNAPSTRTRRAPSVCLANSDFHRILIVLRRRSHRAPNEGWMPPARRDRPPAASTFRHRSHEDARDGRELISIRLRSSNPTWPSAGTGDGAASGTPVHPDEVEVRTSIRFRRRPLERSAPDDGLPIDLVRRHERRSPTRKHRRRDDPARHAGLRDGGDQPHPSGTARTTKRVDLEPAPTELPMRSDERFRRRRSTQRCVCLGRSAADGAA